MFDINRGIRRISTVVPRHEVLLTRLAESRHPVALWIGSSDSRVDPHLITGSQPGALIVARLPDETVADDGQDKAAPSGVDAAIEYAVGVVGVRDIIVCGRASASLDEVDEQQVLDRLEQVKRAPAVAHQLSNGGIGLHAWIHDRRIGRVRAHDGERFVDVLEVALPGPPRRRVRSHKARGGV